MNEVKVNKDELYKVYKSMKESIQHLEFMLAEVGCLHDKKVNVTTMGKDDADNIQRWYCPECEETIEEVKE